MKKKISAIALLLVLVMVLSLGLAACGDKGGSSGNNTPVEPPYDPSVDGEKVEQLSWADINANKYMNTLMEAAKGTKAPALTETDAFTAATHFELSLERINDNKRKTKVNVGVDVEVCFDRKTYANSTIKFAIVDKAKPHTITVTALLSDPENIYIDYLGQKIKFVYNNGIVETGDETNTWYPLTLLKAVFNTDINVVINKIVSSIPFLQITAPTFPLLGGETLTGFDKANNDKFDLNMLLNAFLNLPLYKGDVVPTEYNVFTPINRIVDVTEAVPFGFQKAIEMGGLNKVIAKNEKIDALLGKLPPAIGKIVNKTFLTKTMPILFKALAPKLTDANIQNIMTGVEDETIYKNAKVDLSGIIGILTNPPKELEQIINIAMPMLFNNVRVANINDGDKCFETSMDILKSMIGSNLKVYYNTDANSALLKQVAVKFTTEDKNIITNIDLKVAPVQIKKVTGDTYHQNVVKELEKYSSDWSVDSKAQLAVNGISIKNIDLSGTYDINIVGALDFTKAANNNMYLSLSNGADKMLEASLKGEDASIKIGKDAKTVAIMNMALPMIKDAMFKEVAAKQAAYQEKIDMFNEEIEWLPAEKDPVQQARFDELTAKIAYCETEIAKLEARKGTLENEIFGRMMNQDGTYNTNFAGIKFTGINFAKLFNQVFNPEEKLVTINTSSSASGIDVGAILDIFGGLNNILNNCVDNDPAVNNFISITKAPISAFIKKIDTANNTMIITNNAIATTAYVYATNPKYVESFAPIFDSDPTALEDQYELMYLFLTEKDVYNDYKTLVTYFNECRQALSTDPKADCTDIYNRFKAAITNNNLKLSQDAFKYLAANSRMKSETVSKEVFDAMLASNPVNKAIDILQGSKFFTSAKNLIQNTLFEGSASLSFKVTDNKAIFATTVTVRGASVSYNCAFTISATAPKDVPPITLGNDPYVKAIEYPQAVEDTFAE